MQNIHFPRVYKNSEMHNVTIVYRNRAEEYTANGFNVITEWNGKDDKKFDAYDFEEMLIGMKFKRVHEGE